MTWRQSAAVPHHVRISIEHDGWEQAVPEVDRLVRRAVLAALTGRSRPGRDTEVSVLLTGDDVVARLNSRYRNRGGTTNVLSFGNGFGGAGDDLPLLLGDIVLAFETVADEAASEGRRFEDHLSHLVVHGVLHLLGFDHEEDGPAERMEKAEIAILSDIGIANPYDSNADSRESGAR